MKPVFAKKAARPDPELLTLKAELLEAQGDLAQAYRQFDQALDPELVESCVYQISAVKARCNYLIRAIKERSPEAAAAAGACLYCALAWGLPWYVCLIAAILAGFFLVALIRVFSSPFRLALKLLLNTLLGFLALGAVRLTAGLTGIALGLNLWNALVIAVLGLPGFVLLLLVQWIL